MNRCVWWSLLLFVAVSCFSLRGVAAEEPSESISAEPRQNAPDYDGLDRYDAIDIEGWQILLNKALTADAPELWNRARRQLEHQLYEIKRRVPAEAVARLQKIPIWVERNHSQHPGACFHPDPGWLFAHNMNPKKAGCVELSNMENFISWSTTQPFMVLHELAHAYHNRFLRDGFENAEVRAAYASAKENKLYESVLYAHGGKKVAYAMNDPMEYFAENSEAFFGTNDFYPFVRAELAEHDPLMYELLKKIWGVK